MLTHRFGANYVPSKDWYYQWNALDSDAIARDLDALAGIGLDHIRLMTIWPWFHPNATWVSPAHLDRLRKVVDLAGERGLDVWVVAFTGWLSGYAFEPPYLRREEFYTDSAWEAQSRYLAALAGAVGDAPNFAGIDLGNELNCCWQAQTAEIGDAWMARALAECARVAPGKIHGNGVDHQPWFRPATFSPQALARQEIVPLHCWTYFTGAMEKGGPLGPRSVGLLRSMAALARSFAGDPKKPIWAQEFGASEDWMPMSEAEAFLVRSIEEGVRGGVSWFTWWCSHDIDRRFAFDHLEYSIGLFDVENRPKPIAHRFAECAEAFRGKPVALPSAVRPAPLLDPASVWEWLEAESEQQA